jgi:hypothetical protein
MSSFCRHALFRGRLAAAGQADTSRANGAFLKKGATSTAIQRSFSILNLK